MMSNHDEKLRFEDSLGEDDYGLIICGKTGVLKGLWIPEAHEEDEVPESIINMCINVFGVDPEEFYKDEDDDMGDPLTDTLH